jgi:hypothetical protein
VHTRAIRHAGTGALDPLRTAAVRCGVSREVHSGRVPSSSTDCDIDA